MFNSLERKIPTALTFILFCIPYFSILSLDSFINTYLFYFYEAELSISLYIIPMLFFITRVILIVIYPFLGFLSDRNYAFTKTLGRKFFWILISGSTIPFLLIMLFRVPVSDSFLFAVVFFILYLTYNITFSLQTINYTALLLNKFRNPKERLLIASVSEILSTIGIMIMALFSPLFINYGDILSYQSLTIPIAITYLVTLIVGIPSLLEEDQLINSYFSPNQAPKEGFFKDFFGRFVIFRQKNFIMLLIGWIIVALFNFLISSNLPYYIIYVLDSSIFFYSLLYSSYYIWILIGVSISFILSWFIGHLKVFIISGFATAAALIMFFFFPNNYVYSEIFFSSLGFTIGLETASIIPLMGDVFDEYANTNCKRSESTAYGILIMFGAISLFLSSFLSALVKLMTGFESGSFIQTPLAQLGITILISIIPGSFLIVGMIIFVIFYDLKPEKTQEIRGKLERLQI